MIVSYVHFLGANVGHNSLNLDFERLGSARLQYLKWRGFLTNHGGEAWFHSPRYSSIIESWLVTVVDSLSLTLKLSKKLCILTSIMSFKKGSNYSVQLADPAVVLRWTLCGFTLCGRCVLLNLSACYSLSVGPWELSSILKGYASWCWEHPLVLRILHCLCSSPREGY